MYTVLIQQDVLDAQELLGMTVPSGIQGSRIRGDEDIISTNEGNLYCYTLYSIEIKRDDFKSWIKDLPVSCVSVIKQG